MIIIWLSLAFLAGVVSFPLALFMLRDVLPPTLFAPSDW